MTRVLCWDIDGTLVSTARAGVFALEDAARAICGGSPDFSAMKTAGLTDSEIAALVITDCRGDAPHELLAEFLAIYERHLPDRLHRRRGGVMPGVIDNLEALVVRGDVVNRLLTGNTAAGARAKLEHYGLAGYFDGGAFCAPGDTREAIARRARAEAADRLGREPRPEDFFVIGDTPADVRSGQAAGARTVGIASGTYAEEELRASGAWLVLPELPEPPEFMEALGLA